MSHVFLLLSKQVENPQPKVFQWINTNYVQPLVPPLAGVDASGVPIPAAPVDPAAPGSAVAATADPAVGAGLSPFGTGAAPGAAAPVDVTPVAPPGVDPATLPKPAKKRIRHEFVLVFIWRDNANAPMTPGLRRSRRELRPRQRTPRRARRNRRRGRDDDRFAFAPTGQS